jgi:tRNA/rRNA methyltransferase/tRNA (cytidine32/uridine32-2'-O)-methyltransferase
MKNMGLSRLRIVAPEAPLDDEVILARTVHAQDVWEQAEFFDSLPSAVADLALITGTTRRRGKKRKDFSLTPEELALALHAREGKAGIIFGNERTGLTVEELALCNLASHVPVDETFPSLNLSHAVQIYAYCLRRTFVAETGGGWVPVGAESLDGLVSTVADSLESVGFYKQAGRAEQERFFRDIFARSGLTQDDVRRMDGIFRKMARLVQGIRAGGENND